MAPKGKPRKLGSELLQQIHELMPGNDELTLKVIQRILREEHGVACAMSTIRKVRSMHKMKKPASRVVHVRKVTADQEDYGNVIFTDECSIEMDSHPHSSFRRQGEKPKLMGKPEHPYKVHV